MSNQKAMRPLLLMHLLCVVLIGVGFGFWIWTNTPARQVYARSAKHREASDPLTLQPLFRAAEAVTGDVVFAAASLALFAIGTRVYTKKLQTWLDARGAGDAASFGTQGLEDRAIAANNRTGVGR